ncbi:hypothetical protein [Sulfitobacter sp. 1A16808]|uniref:hypothetical protein n=1 Tax=Sulfitobacter sp. 1A16808 TaxID=3368572 RepID=UPI0037454FDF
MTLEEALKDRGIANVLVVDDCFDEVPLANDLADVEEAWSNFHDDWNDEIEAILAKRYQGDLEEPHQLRQDDAYIAALWHSRDEIGAEPLFDTYEATQRVDIEIAANLEKYLTELGLNCTRAGRSFADAEVNTDLIVIDLFLGAAQDPNAAELSKQGLRKIAEQYGAEMPPAILFSNSSRLASNADEYRDHVGLLESGFRILAKSELKTDGALKRQLQRLLSNRNETVVLARFLSALEAGMADASKRTISIMRGMNLSDLAQLRQLLLEFEGKALGAYLVDVFDRVLQHEIENQELIITTANEVSKIDDFNPGPPYLAGAFKTQELVARMISQAEARLPLGGSDEFPVAFGDVYVKSTDVVAPPKAADVEIAIAAAEVDAPSQPEKKDDVFEVFLVVTPACDLIRGAAESALFLKGQSRPISDQSWLYKGDKSPAVRIDGTLCRIDWDLQKYATIPLAELQTAIDEGNMKRVSRLRQPHALELQQKLLTSMGRVGLPAPMPARIETTIDAYYYGSDLRRKNLDVLNLSEGSACFVGRDKDANRVVSLVLTETACENLVKALDRLSEEDVHEKGRDSLKAITASTELLQHLEKGILLSSPSEDSPKEIKISTKAGQLPVLHIVWNGDGPVEEQNAKHKHVRGIIFHIQTQNLQSEEALALEPEQA